MNKSRLLGAVCAFASLFVFASGNAGAITLIGSSDPSNVVNNGGSTPAINLDVTFDTNSPNLLSFQDDDTLQDTFGIEIFNNTGTPWTSFGVRLNDTNTLNDPAKIGNIQFVSTDAWNANGNLDETTVNSQTMQFSFTGDAIEDTGSFTVAGTTGVYPVPEYFTMELIPNYMAPVPIPAAVWLFGSGLLGLTGMARRKKAA